MSTNIRVTSTDHKQSKTWRYYRCLDCAARYKTEECYVEYMKPGPKRKADMPARINYARGEAIGSAILTASNVKHLRQLASEGHNRRDLAERFGMSLSTIDRIIKRRTWKHI